MKAVILAGGFGTRLSGHVPGLPKPMAPVAGRPFLEFIFDRLIASGINEIILSVGYRADTIVEYFGEKYHTASIEYSLEDEPLGTGGAIAHAIHDVCEEPVLIMNGDTYLQVNYNELISWYMKSPSQVAMVLKEVNDVTRYGSVLLSGGRVTGFLEKGKTGKGYINAGVYIIHSDIFKLFESPNKFSFEADILQKYCSELSPRAFLTDGYFIDIGIPDDYERAQYELPAVACIQNK
jgi:D-glycero-alpha-D-manno-heptose 1-phosphate guanylyltransferase